MFCAYCGKEMPDNAKFCPICGKAVRQQQTDEVKDYGPKENIENAAEGRGIASLSIGEKKKIQWDDKYFILTIIGAMVICGLIGVVVRTYIKGENRREESAAAYADSAAAGWEAEETESLETGMSGAAGDTQSIEMDIGRSPEPYVGDDMESLGAEEQSAENYDSLEGGIHTYSYIVDDCSWSQAFVKAKNMGGYLAHINSAEEYEYILDEIEALGLENIQFRIGGRRDLDGDSYYWVNENNEFYGEKLNDSSYWAYQVWMRNEPSFVDGEIQENCMDIYYYSKESRWGWNDVPDDIIENAPFFSGRIGYIVEYDE